MANDLQWKIILSLVLLLGPIGYKCCSPDPEESSNAGGGNDGGGNGGNGNGGNGNGTGGNDGGKCEGGGNLIDESQDSKLPVFTWDHTGDARPIKLNIDFKDGQPKEVAHLYPELDDDGVEDLHLLVGSLTVVEKTAQISVIGKPNTVDFDVTMTSDRHPGGFFEVKNGKTLEVTDDECGHDGPDVVTNNTGSPNPTHQAHSANQAVPSSFVLKLSLHYDNAFLQHAAENSHSKAKTLVREMLTAIKPFFSSGLPSSVTLKYTSISHVNENLQLGNGQAGNKVRYADGKISGDSSAHLIHHFTYHQVQNGVGFTGGIALVRRPRNQGGACDKSTAITQFQKASWRDHRTDKIQTEMTFRHEIGHQLGMAHDFEGSSRGQSWATCRKVGRTSCCNIDTIMDYYQPHKRKWSQCSKQDFRAVSYSCMGNTVPPGQPCEDNSGSAYVCSNRHRWGGCHGSNSWYFSKNCKKTCNLC